MNKFHLIVGAVLGILAGIAFVWCGLGRFDDRFFTDSLVIIKGKSGRKALNITAEVVLKPSGNYSFYFLETGHGVGFDSIGTYSFSDNKLSLFPTHSEKIDLSGSQDNTLIDIMLISRGQHSLEAIEVIKIEEGKFLFSMPRVTLLMNHSLN